MEIEVTQSKLSKALNNVSRIAVGRVTLPVLNNVLIRVEDKKVSLVTTNLDMAIVDFLPVSSSKNGVVTVPARLLTEFVNNLPRDEIIKISSKDAKVTITAGKYTSTINGSPADDFPELPEINEEKAVVFKMSIDDFKNGISSVAVASSNDLSRPALTGIFFNTADKTLCIAATDGYRLAERKLIKNIESEVSVIVPTSSLQEVLRAINDEMDEIEISFNDDLVRFRLGEVEVVSKLIDASFPDYRRLIPKDNNIIIDLKRDELIRVTKLAALFARSVSGAITCEAKTPNTFSVGSVISELGENASVIDTPVSENCKVNLSSRFLLDALNSLDGSDVVLKFSSKATPVILQDRKNQDYTHILMPISS